MQDFAHWLEELGMSEYAQRFAANDIDIEVLGDRPTPTLIALAFQSGIAGSS
jgi:hypothetical protein